MVMEPAVSEAFFDKYAWTFLKHTCLAYIYCVLDFEATCDRELGNLEKEVLAIPVALLDTDTVTRTIVSEFQTVLVCATCDLSRTHYCGEGGIRVFITRALVE